MQYDDGDDRTQFTGEGEARISGDGRLLLRGDAPRYRVLEPLFENVSVTFDALRESEEQDLDYQGFVVGVRSQHYNDDECGANTYYASLTYDGYARLEKELFHGEGRNAFYPENPNEAPVLYEDGVPRMQWINLNFTVTTTNEGNARLQFAVNGKQVLDYTDNGEWSVDTNGVECDGYYPDNKIILSPGFVLLRNDGLGQAQYKNLDIREVQH
jgi:hypothetical protein